MNWELLSVAFLVHESRLRDAEKARRAAEGRHASHPAPRRWQRLREHVGDRLVAWGVALKTPVDAPHPELRMAQPK